MDINQLVKQLRNGDASAGPVLVSIVAPRLLGYAAAIAPDASDVDRELAVELAIENAIDRIELYDPSKGTFVGWLRGFVRYRLADWRREQLGKRAPLPDDLPDTNPVVSRDAGDDGIVSPTSAALAALVLTLSEADQLLVQLRFVELLPHAVIAERLDVSESACRKRLQRVLARLKMLAADDPDFSKYSEGGKS